MLLSDAVDAFLLAVEARGGRPRTVGSYRQRLGLYVQFAGGTMVLADTTRTDLDRWVVSMRRASERWVDHPAHPSRSGGLSKTTIAGRIQAVKAFFRWCVERERLEQSPAKHLRKPRLDQAIGGDKVMTVEDLRALITVAESRVKSEQPLAVRDLALLLFVADTGCRAGEAASLRVGDIDVVAREAGVEGKTGGRVVDFTDRTSSALRAWLDVRPVADHDRVFVGRWGPALAARGIYEVFRRLALEAGIKGRFNPHSLRHLVGQTFTDKTNLELARQKLGHSDVTTTARFYANQDRSRVKAATVKFSVLNGEG